MPALFTYALTEFGKEFFAEAWDEFFLWEDVPEEIEGNKEFQSILEDFSTSSSFLWLQRYVRSWGWSGETRTRASNLRA